MTALPPNVESRPHINFQLPDKILLSSADIEKIFDVKLSTVEQWRLKGVGPKFIKLPGSRLVRYRREDVLDYIQRQPSLSSTTESDINALIETGV